MWEGGIDALLELLAAQGVDAIEGPVPRIGGRGAGTGQGISVYTRDPDDNLLEFISYDADDVARYPREPSDRLVRLTRAARRRLTPKRGQWLRVVDRGRALDRRPRSRSSGSAPSPVGRRLCIVSGGM